MATQATSNLTIVNGMPSAKRLDNGRFRLEFFCDPSNKNEGWYKGNIDKWLPPFGALQDAALENGWTYPKNSDVTYDDMRLVEAGVEFIPSVGTHYVVLAYETLTDTLVAEVDDKEIGPENGLNITERVLIAKAGVSFSEVVGTSTYLGKTLQQFEVENTDAFTRVVARYSDLGILSVSTPLVGGQQRVVVDALGLSAAQVDTALSEVTATHKLIDTSDGNFAGLKTSQYTFEVEDFNVFSQVEAGFDTLDRTELSASSFLNGVVGTDLFSALYLASEQIDNGGTIKIRKSKWSARGVISVRPIQGEEFALAPSYTYVTLGIPASDMTGLTKPDGTALPTTVTWFEPTVQNIEGFPTYSQDVLTAEISGSDVKVDSYEKFFTITDPGVMSTGGAFNSESTSGGAVRFPQALSQPQTFRKKATVDVFLTSSSTITDAEVAYTEKDVNWCSIAFDSFYNNDTDSSASVSASWRSFPQMLNSSGATGTSFASILGVYFAEASSFGDGDTTYTTTGIYRVEIDKYQRKTDATQLYLRTVVTFA